MNAKSAKPPKALTFDCYGTLIDWKAGVAEAVAPLFERAGRPFDPDEFFPAWWEVEFGLIGGPYQKYREILRESLRQVAERLELEVPQGEEDCLGDAMGTWEPFPEVVGVLKRLKQEGLPLVIVSNVDDDIVAGSLELLEVPFDHVVTAEQVRSYKPRPAHFEQALELLRLEPGEVLHVAASMAVDIFPSNELGFRTFYVNRGEDSLSAAPVSPDGSAPNLRGLPEFLDL